MKQFTMWPPPDWTECVVTWDYILQTHTVRPQDLYNWCDHHTSPNRYHAHGWQSTEGFAFRFEDQKDAIMFKLTWQTL